MESKVTFEKKSTYDASRGNKNGGGFQVRNSSFSIKMRFTVECESLNNCVFDCSNGKWARNFDKNMKRSSISAAGKYERGAEITTLIKELVKVGISKPKFMKVQIQGNNAFMTWK